MEEKLKNEWYFSFRKFANILTGVAILETLKAPFLLSEFDQIFDVMPESGVPVASQLNLRVKC